jgi:translation elongation factor EF-Tu-like GTPase
MENLIYKKWLDTGASKVFDVMAYDKYSVISSRTQPEFVDTKGTVNVKAKLRLKTTAEGGRQKGIHSGYRPNHVFEYVDGEMKAAYMGQIEFDGTEMLPLGEERIVLVRFLFQIPIEEYLTIGRKWWIHEGGRQVGEAEIIEITTPNTSHEK